MKMHLPITFHDNGWVTLKLLLTMALASSDFMLFAFQTVFNPSVFFFLLLYIYLMNVTKLKVYRKQRRKRQLLTAFPFVITKLSISISANCVRTSPVLKDI